MLQGTQNILCFHIVVLEQSAPQQSFAYRIHNVHAYASDYKTPQEQMFYGFEGSAEGILDTYLLKVLS